MNKTEVNSVTNGWLHKLLRLVLQASHQTYFFKTGHNLKSVV